MLNVEDNTNKNSATDGIARWGSWGGSTKQGKKRKRQGNPSQFGKEEKVGRGTAKDIKRYSKWNMLENTKIFSEFSHLRNALFCP